MNMVFLKEEENVDPESGCTFSDISSISRCYDRLHTHDYYEFLFVVKGRFNNYANGKSTLQKEGALIFFRPADIHRIDPCEKQECHLINVTYGKKTFDDLLFYMGDGFDQKSFLSASQPPVVYLDELQKQELLYTLDRLNTIPGSDKKQIRTTLRFLLHELFYRYLVLKPSLVQDTMPEWLFKLCDAMKQKEHFTGGTLSLVALSGKSHAYLCRIFKKHLHTTPTDFVNNLRLEYARNLLLNTDKSIISICYDVGFDSLGHFYKLFAQFFGIPPLHYRKKYWKNPHAW